MPCLQGKVRVSQGNVLKFKINPQSNASTQIICKVSLPIQVISVFGIQSIVHFDKESEFVFG